jgi:hypothetical protein
LVATHGLLAGCVVRETTFIINIFPSKYTSWYNIHVGRDSSVGTATGYGLDGPGIESRWVARFSAPVQTGPGPPPSLLCCGYGFFPGGKEGPGHDADPSPPSRATVMKG